MFIDFKNSITCVELQVSTKTYKVTDVLGESRDKHKRLARLFKAFMCNFELNN